MPLWKRNPQLESSSLWRHMVQIPGLKATLASSYAHPTLPQRGCYSSEMGFGYLFLFVFQFRIFPPLYFLIVLIFTVWWCETQLQFQKSELCSSQTQRSGSPTPAVPLSFPPCPHELPFLSWVALCAFICPLSCTERMSYRELLFPSSMSWKPRHVCPQASAHSCGQPHTLCNSSSHSLT